VSQSPWRVQCFPLSHKMREENQFLAVFSSPPFLLEMGQDFFFPPLGRSFKHVVNRILSSGSPPPMPAGFCFVAPIVNHFPSTTTYVVVFFRYGLFSNAALETLNPRRALNPLLSGRRDSILSHPFLFPGIVRSPTVSFGMAFPESFSSQAQSPPF